jgi:type II secretory pathway predicted ATPase ExeA
MYEQFYNLTRLPFANIPDPEFLFLSPQHRQALSILQYALIARAGFCVITGDIGAGKTTLVRRVLQTLDQQVHVGPGDKHPVRDLRGAPAVDPSRIRARLSRQKQSRDVR